MNTKLTLNLDKSVIEKAKAYLKSHNTSLSKVIEAYLSSLTDSKGDDVKIILLVYFKSASCLLFPIQNLTNRLTGSPIGQPGFKQKR